MIVLHRGLKRIATDDLYWIKRIIMNIYIDVLLSLPPILPSRALYGFIPTLDKLDLPVNTFIRPIIIQLQGRHYTNQFQF